MSNLVRNARINLQARAYCNLGLLVLAICFVIPLEHPQTTEQPRAIIIFGGVLFWLVMQWTANVIVGRLKD
jgi:hypothetical protein